MLIFFKSVEVHTKHVEEVLQLLRDGSVSLKLQKCFFFRKSVDYLDHVLLRRRLAVAKKSTLEIEDVESPRDKTKIRSFLGALNVVRRFIKGFIHLADPVNRWIQKDAKHAWDEPFEEQLK